MRLVRPLTGTIARLHYTTVLVESSWYRTFGCTHHSLLRRCNWKFNRADRSPTPDSPPKAKQA